MEKITITRPVIIKHIVTADYKKKVAEELQQAVARIDLQIQHLDFHSRRLLAELEKRNPQGINAARQQLDKERAANIETRQNLLDKLKQTAKMAEGDKVVHGRAESIEEIRVGDDWLKFMSVEVIVRDGLVIEIRQGEHPGG
jgi:DNA-directed RNA polymerase beta' subunit